MNNKDFIGNMAARLDISAKEAQKIVTDFTHIWAESFEEGDTVAVQGFGTFEVKKKMERIVVNPSTKQRQLVPPKLAMSFKPANSLKEKVK